MSETHGDSANIAASFSELPPALPSELLRQAVDDGGSKIVLVVGAGVSIEAPTSLETGAVYARDAHRRLVQDGVLSDGDCTDPSDLSILADVVFEKGHGSQRELTSRLPRDWGAPSPCHPAGPTSTWRRVHLQRTKRGPESHPLVADAAVIGVRADDGEEIPKAFIVAVDNALTSDDVMSFVAEHVAPYKKIRRVEFIEAIPKSTAGKILRKDLRARDSR